MPDIIDDANDLAQLQLNNILKSRIPEQPAYYKVCRNCQELTPDGHAFCDEDCRDDFEIRESRRNSCQN